MSKIKYNLLTKLESFSMHILSMLEPNDVYEQANRFRSERSFRMKVSDFWYLHVCKPIEGKLQISEWSNAITIYASYDPKQQKKCWQRIVNEAYHHDKF